jgi:hypothetical protein
MLAEQYYCAVLWRVVDAINGIGCSSFCNKVFWPSKLPPACRDCCCCCAILPPSLVASLSLALSCSLCRGARGDGRSRWRIPHLCADRGRGRGVATQGQACRVLVRLPVQCQCLQYQCALYFLKHELYHQQQPIAVIERQIEEIQTGICIAQQHIVAPTPIALYCSTSRANTSTRRCIASVANRIAMESGWLGATNAMSGSTCHACIYLLLPSMHWVISRLYARHALQVQPRCAISIAVPPSIDALIDIDNVLAWIVDRFKPKPKSTIVRAAIDSQKTIASDVSDKKVRKPITTTTTTTSIADIVADNTANTDPHLAHPDIEVANCEDVKPSQAKTSKPAKPATLAKPAKPAKPQSKDAKPDVCFVAFSVSLLITVDAQLVTNCGIDRSID